MKINLIISALCLVLISGAYAGEPKSRNGFTAKNLQMTTSYNKIEVGENLKVVLSNNPNTEITIEGQDKFVKEVRVTNINGVLYLNAPSKFYGKGTIYLSAKDVSLIHVKENSQISSDGFLKCNNLKLIIEEGGKASVKNIGGTEVFPGNNTDLNFEKFLTING